MTTQVHQGTVLGEGSSHKANGKSVSIHDSPKITRTLYSEQTTSPFKSLAGRHVTPFLTSSAQTNERLGSFSHEGDHGDGQTLHSTQTDAASRHTDPSLRASPALTPQRSKSESKLFSPSSSQNAAKLSKRETLKVEKQKYRTEKKRAARELLSTLQDPSVVVMADWLKVRGTLKSWTRLWCVLKPGVLLLYKSHKQKSAHWVGTILLNTVEIIERPSKKDGFCFKLFHPLEQSIWATKGPKGENFGAITQPLPFAYCIFRAPSEQAGKCWMDALELALRCSGLLMKTMTREPRQSQELDVDPETSSINLESESYLTPLRSQLNESDCERHFEGYGLEEDPKTDREEEEKKDTDSDSDQSEEEKETFDDNLQPIETQYVENLVEELGQQGDACQTEEVADENKSIIWTLVKQVRPGMDLSKVVLPTFILEPRSFLDKLSDYYYHADLLSEAVTHDDAYSRMKDVVRWYLSGFYKKPKGLKKPYNPILGETFRCFWRHPKSGTRTFYIAEQISHHPPVTAFYITNRQDGFSISGSILAKSKFYGNSLSAILDGAARLTFLTRGEDYVITMPYAHCKGILIGTLTMEYGGKVTIECEKTGYRAELEFKLKPFLGIGEASNRVTGKLKLGSETLASIDGKWDQEIYIRDKKTERSELFWNPTAEVKVKRLKRYTVRPDQQRDNESERLWRHVTSALHKQEEERATNEKFVLEDQQRNEAKERKAKMEEWVPTFFERNELTADWEYKYKDLRPWDAMNDVIQYEHDYVITTKTRHRTPMVRTTSIANMEEGERRAHKSQSPMERARLSRLKRASMKQRALERTTECSTPENDVSMQRPSESSESGNDAAVGAEKRGSVASPAANSHISASLSRAIQPLVDLQKDNNDKLANIQIQLSQLQRHVTSREEVEIAGWLISNRDLFIIAVVLVIQLIVMWLFKR